MALFLNGGGCASQVQTSYRLFKEKIDTTKPLLYIPLAMEKKQYASCLAWINKELAMLDFPEIEMITSAKELCSKDLYNYSAIFIGGGNTYKLLSDLQSCGALSKIAAYIAKDGVIFGGSAGAILFGKAIDTCQYDDTNDVNLQDTTGLNQVFGAYVGAHYPNAHPEVTQNAADCFTKISFDAPVIALPEEDTLVIDTDTVRVIGNNPYHIFYQGIITKVETDQIYTTASFKNLIYR